MTNSLQAVQEHHVSRVIDQSGGSQPFHERSQSDLIEFLRVSVRNNPGYAWPRNSSSDFIANATCNAVPSGSASSSTLNLG